MKLVLVFIMLSFLSQIFCGPPKPTEPAKLNFERNKRSLAEILKDLDSKDWNTRSLALAEITNGRYVEAIPEVRKYLKDSHPVVRGSAAVALGEFQDKASLQNIIQLLNDKEVPKDVVVDALRRMKDPSAAKSLVPLLDSEDTSLRLIVVEALTELNNRTLGKEILKLAEKNQNPEKDKTYAMILGRLEVKEAEEYLFKLAKREKSSPTLAAVFLALGKIKSKKAIPILTQAIGEDFEKGRENASIALREIKDVSSLNFLYSYLKNTNKEIRYTSAEIIAEIPNPETSKVIKEILDGTKKEFYGASCFVVGRLKLQVFRSRVEEILLDKSVPEREIIAQTLGWLGDSKSVDVLVKVLEEKDGEGRYGAAWALGFLEPKLVFVPLKKASQS
ncbi:MAG: HEAT repeat domain-containing protein, partial [Leptospiraceae bacterium]|nr:HEAT repeat domain-containing protein [Leptospiraceae bacterium]